MCISHEKDILERIVNQNGDCTGMDELCPTCPLNRLKKRPDGSYYSCWESIIPVTLASLEEADAYYRAAAENKLSELVIEDLFLGESDED